MKLLDLIKKHERINYHLLKHEYKKEKPNITDEEFNEELELLKIKGKITIVEDIIIVL